jgi:release factor glutamine methyltransferase
MNSFRTLADCIAQLTAQLKPITETPRLEAELLLAHALGLSRASLLARLRETVAVSQVMPLLARRLNHEPLAYIFGEWEFFGLPFFVQAPLLVPRPETEHLVEVALDFLKERKRNFSPPFTVADLCCGTGCVAVAVGYHAPGTCIYAGDIRADAVETTTRNAARNNVSVQCAQGDLFAPLDPLCRSFDLILSNPPYVPEDEWSELSPVITKHEDPGALLAGKDGLDLVRRIIPAARERLKPGGMLALEIGDGQFQSVAALMQDHGFEQVMATPDLAGIERIISGVLIS